MKKVMLILAVVILVIVTLSGGRVFGADTNEVAALRAELAKVTAERNKLKYANALPIHEHIRPLPDEWKEAYGNIPAKQLIYNIKANMADTEQLRRAIRLIAAAINGITDPNDPNSLAARVEVLEEVAEDFDKFVSYTLRSGIPYEEAVRFDYYALKLDHSKCKLDKDGICRTYYGCKVIKEDDPNEVRP